MKRLVTTAAPRVLRSLLVAALIGLGLPLVAATTPSTVVNPPVVVVYPLVGGQGVASDVGASISLVIATQLSQLGGINVKAAPPGTQQADFLNAARKLEADFYIAGLVAPVGDQVSVVEQLVSTKSGAIVYSNTVTLAVYGDARASATALHDLIVQNNRNGFTALSPEVIPTSKPAPLKPVAAAPAPTATPGVAKVVAILKFDGSARAEARDYVPASLIRTFHKYGVEGMRAPLETKDVGNLGPLVCAQAGADYLVGGSLADIQEDPINGIWFDAKLTLLAFNCTDINAKPRAFVVSVTAGAEQTAIDIAVDRALKGYMAQPKR